MLCARTRARTLFPPPLTHTDSLSLSLFRARGSSEARACPDQPGGRAAVRAPPQIPHPKLHNHVEFACATANSIACLRREQRAGAPTAPRVRTLRGPRRARAARAPAAPPKAANGGHRPCSHPCRVCRGRCLARGVQSRTECAGAEGGHRAHSQPNLHGTSSRRVRWPTADSVEEGWVGALRREGCCCCVGAATARPRGWRTVQAAATQLRPEMHGSVYYAVAPVIY